MHGQNITMCWQGLCPYRLPECCYECDWRRICEDRCDQGECRKASIRARLGIVGTKKAPHST